MRDEHADACLCPRCAPPRLVWINHGRVAPQPLATAINAQLPAILARDLRAVFEPVADANPLLERELARLDAALAR
jgi:hypothetical protein